MKRNTKKDGFEDFKYRHLEKVQLNSKTQECTYRDTTILSSLDFYYTFLHRRSCQAVVSVVGEQHSTVSCWDAKQRNPQCKAKRQVPTFSLQLDNMLIMLRQTDCTERAGDQSSVKMDKQM